MRIYLQVPSSLVLNVEGLPVDGNDKSSNAVSLKCQQSVANSHKTEKAPVSKEMRMQEKAAFVVVGENAKN